MIEINHLRKQFGDTVACDIDTFRVNDGDILGLMGNNGAGKTTLFRMMLDLLKPDAGTVLLDGINPALSEEWKQTTGAYIDDGFLIDYLTPDEYFAFLGKISGIPQSVVDERLSQYEHFAGGEVLGQRKLIRDLSAGNKHKVGIMAALVREPRLVILDEPFNFLDPTSQAMLKRLLTGYASRTGATLLVSSHNLQHTIDISTRIALLESGRIIRSLDNENLAAKEELSNYFGE